MTIKICLFCLCLLGFIASAWGNLDTPINRAILAALEHDTKRTTDQKLFEDRCQTITNTVGFENSITGKARKFSCENLGVGIALYAGSDLGKHSPEKVGGYFVEKLKTDGLKAKLFIKRKHHQGTHIEFYINGQSWLLEPARASDALKLVDGLIAEAKLILFHEGRTKEWIYKPS